MVSSILIKYKWFMHMLLYMFSFAIQDLQAIVNE